MGALGVMGEAARLSWSLARLLTKWLLLEESRDPGLSQLGQIVMIVQWEHLVNNPVGQELGN